MIINKKSQVSNNSNYISLELTKLYRWRKAWRKVNWGWGKGIMMDVVMSIQVCI